MTTHSFSDTPSIAELVRALASVSAKWNKLGIAFGLTVNDLDGIKKGNPHDSMDEWMTKMLDMKMSRSPNFGWSNIIKALKAIKCETLAESIRQEHCLHS